MAFKISVVSGHASFESLPACKVISYPNPGAREDYRPFAQAQFCVDCRGFSVRMIAFEVKPNAESRIEAKFAIPGRTSALLVLAVVPGGLQEAYVQKPGEQPCPLEGVEVIPVDGEDLQGVYWGYHLILPLPLLEQVFPEFLWISGSRLEGNVFKRCSAPGWEHEGSFFPADFAKTGLFDNLGALELVAY